MEENSVGKDFDRRSFLKLAINAVVGVMTAFLSVPVIGYLLSPAFKRSTSVWTEVGPTIDFGVGGPKQVTYRVLAQDSWSRRYVERSAWVVAKGGENYKVFSPICTHLGCAYNWSEEDGRFECPCHNSFFDIDGGVITGPAPRPLDTYEVKAENQRLFVRSLLKGKA